MLLPLYLYQNLDYDQNSYWVFKNFLNLRIFLIATSSYLAGYPGGQ